MLGDLSLNGCMQPSLHPCRLPRQKSLKSEYALQLCVCPPNPHCVVCHRNGGGELQAAVESSDWIMVDSWEARQAGYQRSLHVLRSVQDRLAAALETQPPSEAAPGQQVTATCPSGNRWSRSSGRAP